MPNVCKFLIVIILVSISKIGFNQSQDVINTINWVHVNQYKKTEISLRKLLDLEAYSDPKKSDDRYVILFEIAKFYHQEMKDFKQAMYWMKKLKQEVVTFGDQKLTIQYHNSLGEIYNLNNTNAEKSIAELNTAIMLIDSKNIIFPKELVLKNLSNSYSIKGQFYKSIKLQHEALRIAISKNNSELLCEIAKNMGINFNHLNKYDSAEYYLKKSFNYALLTKDNTDDAHIAKLLGGQFKNVENYKQALPLLQYSFNRIQSLTGYSEMADLCNSLSEIYNSQNDKSNALKFKELQILYKDSSDRFNLNREEFIYKHNLQLKNLKAKEASNNYKKKHLKLQLIVGLLIVVCILFIFILIQYRRKKNRQLQSVKQTSSKDYLNVSDKKTSYPHVEKNHLIKEIAEKLNDALPEIEPEQKEKIENLLQNLQANSNDRWNEFELNFLNSHPDFYDKLNENHPKLSPNEKKLCAFLSINMNTKEIGSITGQTAHSINIARGRLRKKLRIDHTDLQIADFLNQYIKK